MVVKPLGNGQYTGLSSDTKPTPANTAVNATFEETDTDDIYRNNGTTWSPTLVQEAYNAVIYKAGSTYKSRKGDGTVLGSSTTLDAVVQAALDVKGLIVWKSSSDGSAYIPSGSFTGWNLSEDTTLLIGQANNITMPNAYAGYVFTLDDTVGGDHQLSRVTVEGGRFTEGGASPQANWTLFRIKSGSSTAGNTGVYGNRFYRIYVKRCKTMFDLIANSGTQSWINGNRFDSCWCDYPKQGIVFQQGGSVGASLQAINKNMFYNVVIQGDPSYDTEPLAMTHGVKDISGVANGFFGCIMWDVEPPNCTCNIINKAENTLISGGNMVQEPYDWELSQNFGRRTIIEASEKTGGESVGSNVAFNPFIRKVGTFMGAGGTSTTLVGDGLLTGLTSAGGTIGNSLTISGCGKRASTGTTQDTITGARTGTIVGIRYWNPFLIVKLKSVQTTAQRIYVGYCSALNPTINTADDPLVNLSGYGLYHSTTNATSATNWLLARNTGTASSTITDTGIAANVTTLQTLYIAGWEEGPKFQWRIGDIPGQIGEHTTTIPAQTTGLALGVYMSNPGTTPTADKSIDLMDMYYKLNKSEG